MAAPSELSPAISTHMVAMIAVLMIWVSCTVSPEGFAVDLAGSARDASVSYESKALSEGEYVIFIGDKAYRAYLIPEKDISQDSTADSRVMPLRF